MIVDCISCRGRIIPIMSHQKSKMRPIEPLSNFTLIVIITAMILLEIVLYFLRKK